MIAVDVMNLHHVLCRERQSTFFTFALLPFQEFDHPQRFKRVPHQPFGPVNPIPIEGTFRTDHFGVSSNSGLLILVKIVCAIAETDPPLVFTPVAAVAPTRPFARMAEGRPAPEFVIELGTHPVENLFGTARSKVVGPASDNGIELADQAGLRTAPVSPGNLFQLGQMALLGLLTRFDDGLETGFGPVRPSFISAYPILTDVEPQKVKAHLALILTIPLGCD